jgi:hypothetical protein
MRLRADLVHQGLERRPEQRRLQQPHLLLHRQVGRSPACTPRTTPRRRPPSAHGRRAAPRTWSLSPSAIPGFASGRTKRDRGAAWRVGSEAIALLRTRSSQAIARVSPRYVHGIAVSRP